MMSRPVRRAVIASAAVALALAGCSSNAAESHLGQTAEVNPSSAAAVEKARAAVRITGEVSFGGQYSAGGVTFDPQSKLLYVANPQDNTVSVVDPKTKSITKKISVDNHPVEVAVDGSNLYVTQVSGNSTDTRNSPGTLSFVDLNSGSVTDTVSLGTGPTGLAVDRDSHVAYVARANSSAVVAIDLNSRTTRTLNIIEGGRAGGIAVDSTTHLIYGVDGNNGRVVIADPSGNIVGSAPIGEMPRGIGVDPGNKRVYVPSTAGSITVIDTESRKVVATIDTGSSPGTIGIDTSSHIFYSTDKDGKVFALDPATNTVLASFNVGSFPATPAVDPETHTVYVSAQGVVSIVEP